MVREIPCEEAARYVYGYLDGELEPETEKEFLHHVERCRKCMGVTEFERRILEFVHRSSGVEEAPEGLRDRVDRIFATAGDAGGDGG
ncbi:MAG: zf-HC2 domain-containing protein [Gemmatimonadota bacterium]|nr:zf-HC2 domain-containing protein [Gemmatimonadota bacterium]